ncbi:MAG: pyridoxamine 5'-phosphate oxidase, partial [Cyanobacteria bacterium P01_G01_bin.4]
ANFSPPPPGLQTPLPTFCLLLLSPHTVDHLSLRGEPQDRVLYRRVDQQLGEEDKQWSVSNVNP